MSAHKKSHHSINEMRTFPNRRYAERRHWLDSVKIASGCIVCGVWGPPEVLQFDHVRGEKRFGVGSSWNQGRKALEEEIAKCEIVCSNCHAIRTSSRLQEKKTGEPPFEPFPKIPRLSRPCTVTEKIDGTNAAVWVDGDGDVWAASKNRWLTKAEDNYNFAAWVDTNAKAFLEAGQGVYRGEWWGTGIQRGYDIKERRFSLFNVSLRETPERIPECCDLVPVLYEGVFDLSNIDAELNRLRQEGSRAAPGFMKPEGIMIYHHAARQYFKKTIEKDDEPKSRAV